MTRFRIALLVASAALVALPASALADSDVGEGTTNGKLPRIISQAPMKPLAFGDARRAQARAKRTGHFPRGPLLATQRHLTKSRALQPDDRRRTPSPDAQAVPIEPGKPTGANGKLFGFAGTYDGKKWGILNWVNYVYSLTIPQLGGAFRQPAVAEVPPGGTTPAGCGPISNNATYCFGPNAVGWSTDFGHMFFDGYGDAAFAAYMAHEYGHGAQNWFGFFKGWFRYTLYSEGFADCMAGGWLYWMHAHGYTDSVGRGDTQEIVDGLVRGSDTTRDLGGHGDAQWRVGMASYGWNYGMQGCRNWGRYVNSQ
jgi:hypothetical protein